MSDNTENEGEIPEEIIPHQECGDQGPIENDLPASTDNSLSAIYCNIKLVEEKRVELDNIQKDLDTLMSKLNTFISDLDDSSSYHKSLCDDLTEGKNNESLLEKQDGPSEKELNAPPLKNGEDHSTSNDQFYFTNEAGPPEINWDTVGPILQKHVADLQQIHELNQMTNAVVQRIRNVAKINEADIFGMASNLGQQEQNIGDVIDIFGLTSSHQEEDKCEDVVEKDHD